MGTNIFKRIKSIEQLKSEFDYDYKDSALVLCIEHRGINDDMICKFGDGREYEFKELELADSVGGFTHKCVDDGWYYHKSWFEDDIDFEIEELFEI
jgi:hypothetical protein